MEKPAEQVLSLSERVAASYSDLASAATVLNEVSDELGKFIESMNTSIQKLNIGIEAWVDMKTGYVDPDDGDYEAHFVGYAKSSGRWGISLKRTWGNENHPESGGYEVWHFNEAPRVMRVDAIDKLPDVLDRLKRKAESTTNKLAKKTEQAKELALAMKNAADAIARPKKK